MIVLSAGMPRAGSGWHYNLVHDLVVASGGRDAREIRKRYLLSPILTEVNCNISALTVKRLIPVMLPSLMGNRFTIKVHSGPTPFALRQINKKRILPIYIYRDPRAALLSAYEYGQRGLEKGRVNAFGHLTSIEKSIEFMLEYVHIWERWMACQEALHVRYEDMLTDYENEIKQLLTFLAINKDSEGISDVVEKFRPGKVSEEDKGMHFYKGQAERFRSVLTKKQLIACTEAFGDQLEKMGYTI
jgi:hypothetical protein